MALFATTSIAGPNGEQVDRDSPIPASWDRDGAFVQEGIRHGWLVERDVDLAPPTEPVQPKKRGNRPVAVSPATPPAGDPYAEMIAGGTANRENEGAS